MRARIDAARADNNLEELVRCNVQLSEMLIRVGKLSDALSALRDALAAVQGSVAGASMEPPSEEGPDACSLLVKMAELLAASRHGAPACHAVQRYGPFPFLSCVSSSHIVFQL